MKYIASEYTKCSINPEDTIMMKGGTGGVECDGLDAQGVIDHLAHSLTEVNDSSPLEDKAPFTADDNEAKMAVVAGNTYISGVVSLTATTSKLITLTTCFSDNSAEEPCTDGEYQMSNTVTVE
jgi:hypothetical protein